MATQIKLPEVAAGATHAVISSWLVNVGDTIVVGQQLAEIETDKAVVELLAEEAGTVLQLIGKPGDEMEVGSTIAVVGAPGESADVPAAEPEAPAAEVPAAPVAAPIATPVATPPAAPVAEAPAPAAASGRQSVSPIARKLAKDSNLDLSQITGTGPGGRIVKRDVLAAAAAGTPAAPATPAAPVPTSSSKELASQEYSSTYSTVPHTSMRKAIARRLTESKSTVPHFYLNADCQVDELLALRKKINESSSVKISVNDMVVRAVAAAFMDVPEANVVWTPDAMIKYESVDVSIAVSTDGGLLTPVLRGVEKRSLSNIATTIVDLAERSRAGKLRQEELEGGSFAITNLGMFGTTSFAAIINPPQSGILAVGAASQRPIVVDGELTIANVMSVTLSADHRAVDGALAAKWLAAFKVRIENPLTMLI
ncbi:MAG: 2-oxo acid dehydrogenase subunit E2 [Micrococcales bacterium]|nr:2-oxo acid dehydrogenase subunit E2 [Micrococcales bacterium]